MVEISHVHLLVTDLPGLNRLFREGGAQLFPQWLSTDYSDEPRIGWWGMRGIPMEALDPPKDAARRGLWPRPFDDWTEPPRGLVLATADAGRAASDLAGVIGSDADWWEVGEDSELGATCRRVTVGRSVLVLAEPSNKGYAATCLKKHGDGPIAVALDGTTTSGRSTQTNPVTDGPATYVRIGPAAAPTLIFLPAGG